MKKWEKENPEKNKACKLWWVKNNPEKNLNAKKKSRVKAREKHSEVFFINDAKIRAKKAGLEFLITAEDIIFPKICPVLGIPIFRSKGRRSNNSPSIDRFDNTKGYTKENIRIISWQANRMKGEMTLDDIEKVYKYMKGQV